MEAMAKREMDFLDEMIAEDTAADPAFPALLAAAEARRNLLRELVARRQARGLSQTLVAARMQTSQSAVARLEGQDDAKESMIDRYAAAIGVTVERRIRVRSAGSVAAPASGSRKRRQRAA
jgi:ribosome-binding protein aMBF1 (putative translation factor)